MFARSTFQQSLLQKSAFQRSLFQKSALKRKLLVSLLLSGAVSSAQALTPEDSVPLGKLPEWAVPTSYDLNFKIDPAQKGYSGITTIHLELKQPADHVWLHSQEISVQKAKIVSADGQVTSAKFAPAASIDGVSIVKFGKTLAAGTYQLVLDFKAPFNQQLDGIYKVTFEGKPYVMTQMEAISARYAFPSFDEPRFKTPFRLTLKVPKQLTALANTQQVSEQPAQAGWKTLTFAPTKPLPTYLLALAVGPWQIQQGPDITPSPERQTTIALRGVTANGKAVKIQHALSETPAIVHALENYFAFGYAFDKLDLLAAPDFAAGAMENPGLITFRDYLMLLDKGSPVSFVQDSFNVNAHELSHQWTGDTVTMYWWDDLWLNESFATWMQSKITRQLHPEYHADLDLVTSAADAMSNDSLVSVRKIRQPILSNADIQTAFDRITYQKGAAVLNMFERYLGEDKFREGIRQYIRKHQFANATADDLIASLAEQSGQGERFAKAMQSFLDQTGVPLLTTSLKQADGKLLLHVKQSRYLPVGSAGSTARVWGVPLCVRYAAAGATAKVQCELVDQPEADIELTGAAKDAWYIPNADAAGYYQFSEAPQDLARLTTVVSGLSDAEKLAYAYAITAAFRHGDVHTAQVVQAATQLSGSNSRQVVTALLPLLAEIHEYILQTPEQRAKFEAVVSGLYLPKLSALGYAAKSGESADDSLLREQLTKLLALQMKVPEVRAALLKQSDDVFAASTLSLEKLTPEILPSILAVRVQEKGDAAFDRLTAALYKNSEPTQRLAILTGLGAATQDVTKQKARQLILDKQVKVGEIRTLGNAINNYSGDRDGLWQWFDSNHDAVFDRVGKLSAGRLPGLFGGNNCTQQAADRLTAFFAPRIKELVGVERGLAQTREQIQLCEALSKTQSGH